MEKNNKDKITRNEIPAPDEIIRTRIERYTTNQNHALILMGLSIVIGVVVFYLMPFKFESIEDIKLETLILKVSFSAPFAWITFFAIKNYNKYVRFEEEYQYKQVMYHFYKNSFQDEHKEHLEPLRKSFSEGLVDNPAKLLDKDKSGPIEKAIATSIAKANVDKIASSFVNSK